MTRWTDAPNEADILSRELLETGGLAAMIANDAPGLRVLTKEERDRSLKATLDARPEGDLWLFAYGSLIWNPTIHSVERRVARIDGWHRSFCLSTIAGRGSPERPGLVLALDEGGSCTGIALRLDERELDGELSLLWQREMVTGAYVPRWIDMVDEGDQPFASALAFTIERTSLGYSGNLATDALIQRLATASGSLGSSADYLFRTRDGLRACGIPDLDLERLAAGVEDAMALDRAETFDVPRR